MQEYRTFDISPVSARAFTVERGKTVRLIDREGGQPGDLVAFNLFDPWECFNQARTRVETATVRPTVGQALWTNTQPPKPLLTITEDSAHALDLLYPPCCRWALARRFNIEGDGCLEHLAQALAPWKIEPLAIPDPLNLFFTVTVAPDGGLSIGDPPSRPGDAVAFHAEMDVLLAVSTCAVPHPGRPFGGYRVEIWR